MTFEPMTVECMKEILQSHRRIACIHIRNDRYTEPIFGYRPDPKSWTRPFCAACAQQEVFSHNRIELHRHVGFDFGEAGTWEAVWEKLESVRDRFGREIWFDAPTLSGFRHAAGLGGVGIHPVHDKAVLMESFALWYGDQPTPSKFHIFINQTFFTQSGTGKAKWGFTAIRLMPGEELEPYKIMATLAADRSMLSFKSVPAEALVPSGTHELERIPNPFGHKVPWLVLKEENQRGSVIGMAENHWLQYRTGVNLLDSDVFSPSFGKLVEHGSYGIAIHETGDHIRGIALMKKDW